MRITFGVHKGKTLEVVALKDPEFVGGLLKSRSASKALLRDEAARLVAVFDERAIERRCMGRDCGRTATRCSVYEFDVSDPMWWCDECDPWQYGARRLVLTVIRTYEDALRFCKALGEPMATRELVHVIAKAKGLKSLTKAQVVEFFVG